MRVEGDLDKLTEELIGAETELTVDERTALVCSIRKALDQGIPGEQVFCVNWATEGPSMPGPSIGFTSNPRPGREPADWRLTVAVEMPAVSELIRRRDERVARANARWREENSVKK